MGTWQRSSDGDVRNRKAVPAHTDSDVRIGLKATHASRLDVKPNISAALVSKGAGQTCVTM